MAETKIGKNLIEMFMFGLYNEPETIFREYVQNASDAILQAIEAGFLKDSEAHISIDIDKHHDKIVIEDNGIGILSSYAESVLKNIALSSKREQNYTAGYFGIGRLVGAGYCKYLKFETSYYNETVKSEITFDISLIEQKLKDKDYEAEPSTLIDECTKFNNTASEEKERHYFRVSLIDIKSEYKEILLDEKRIRDYLSQIAPIAFEAPFKKELFIKSLEKDSFYPSIKKYIERLNQVSITINEQEELKKAYKQIQVGTGDEISKIKFFLLKDNRNDEDNFGDLAWGWFAVTKFDGVIGEGIDKNGFNQDLTRGIRLRMHNIQIGTKEYFDGVKFFRQPRSNHYYTGEVHIINNSILPTPDRSSIQATKSGLILIEEIKQYFRKEVEKYYQEANKIKNALKSINDAKNTKKRIEEADWENQAEKENQISGAETKLARLEDEYNRLVTKQNPVITDLKGAFGIGVESNSLDSLQSSNSKPKPKIEKNEEKLERLKDKYNVGEIKIISKVFKVLEKNLTTRTQITLLDTIKTEIISTLLK